MASSDQTDSLEVLLLWDAMIAARGRVHRDFLQGAAAGVPLAINIAPYGERVALPDDFIEYIVERLRREKTLFSNGTRLEVRIG